MQFWPRKRARRIYPRVRSWIQLDKAQILGFAGYKVGMAHVKATDNRPNSMTKKQVVSIPVTVIECPPVKIVSAVFYQHFSTGSRMVSEIFADKFDKELSRSLPVKKPKHNLGSLPAFDDITLKVYTQPRLTGIGQKKPAVFEIALGGKKEEKLAFVKEHLGKEVKIQDVFASGEQVDIHSVTKGKGYQGPVKRFGVNIRQHKAEKTKRGPGSLGGWRAQGKVMYRVAHAGQMGYHTRTEFNKQVLKIADDAAKVNPDGGFQSYGVVKNTYILIKGSVGGARKRLIRLTKATRPNKKYIKDSYQVTGISTSP